jgi:hypothetical protein
MSGAWGSGSWGSGSWGGGPGGGAISFLAAVPIRENVVRVEFDNKVNLTGLLEDADASRPDKWAVTADSSTTGLSGDPARAVSVVRVEFSSTDEGVAPTDFGRFVDLVLDRPLTPFPAEYDVTWDGIFSADLGGFSSGETRIFSTYRVLDPPQVQFASPRRDFANPQTLSNAKDPLPDPGNALGLGVFRVDDGGDYAFDEGVQSLKKRVIRRLVTRKGAFAHLPNYGVGIPDEAKRLGIAAVITRLAADAQLQIAKEPDVSQARVTPFVDQNNPGLVFFRVAVRPRVGNAIQFDVPFKQAA